MSIMYLCVLFYLYTVLFGMYSLCALLCIVIRATSKKKRKERPLIEKTSKVPTDDEDPSVPIEHKEHEAEASADL